MSDDDIPILDGKAKYLNLGPEDCWGCDASGVVLGDPCEACGGTGKCPVKRKIPRGWVSSDWGPISQQAKIPQRKKRASFKGPGQK